MLDSGWITSGSKTLELEKLVAHTAGISHVACVNSATSGLLLALHWYGVTRGDEVIVPAYTYAATALVVMHLGATPVMVDCGPDLNMNMSQLQQVISAKTKAIIPVDIAGLPCDYHSLMQLVESDEVRKKFKPSTEAQKKLGRPLILSDAAHSFGAVYHNKPTGNWGDLVVFSFHAVKNVTTAEGGAICINLPEEVFNHEVIYRTFKLWSLNGQTKDAFAKTNGAGWKYDIIYPGFKINMPDVCAAIGLAQLRKYTSYLLPERWRVCRVYQNLLSTRSWAELPLLEDGHRRSSCHVFALRVRDITEDQRDKIIEDAVSQGVSLNVHFQPLPLLTVFRERGYRMEDFPEAYRQYCREISLPVYPQLTTEQIQFVVKTLESAYRKVIER